MALSVDGARVNIVQSRFDASSIPPGDLVELPRNVVGKVARELKDETGSHPVARGLFRVGPPVTASLDFSFGSCVTSVAGPNGCAQLYER
jgi:hypothetical protein